MAKNGLAVGGIVAAAALGLAYLATRSTGPVPLPQFTEQHEGPVQAHLLPAAAISSVAYLPHRYPTSIAPNLYSVIAQGFAPRYGIPDPQIAALPAEAD